MRIVLLFPQKATFKPVVNQINVPSRDIRAISVLAKRWSKEDAFFSEMREKVAIDQTELERLCNEAKDEL